jgi:hypothetical protein
MVSKNKEKGQTELYESTTSIVPDSYVKFGNVPSFESGLYADEMTRAV